MPGQGQTVNIAGVKVGEVGRGRRSRTASAVVDMQIKDKYKPIYNDATILLRPKTGLKDMILALDPGTKKAGELPEGGRVRVANTLPDVNPDEVLAPLDGDTRAYLQHPAERRAAPRSGDTTEGRHGRRPPSQDLRETFKRFEPTARDGAKFTAAAVEAAPGTSAA